MSLIMIVMMIESSKSAGSYLTPNQHCCAKPSIKQHRYNGPVQYSILRTLQYILCSVQYTVHCTVCSEIQKCSMVQSTDKHKRRRHIILQTLLQKVKQMDGTFFLYLYLCLYLYLHVFVLLCKRLNKRMPHRQPLAVSSNPLHPF